MLNACVLATVVLWTGVSAQQAAGSDAVETFSPQLDAGYAMRPSVGMFGITELMMAALEADVDEVRRLLDQGTDIDETDQTGGTPLMWAVQGGDLDVVNLLLERGANVNASASRNTTALMTAVISDKEAIGVRLLEAGATFGGELSYQQDYLEYTAAKGHADLVRALIARGADLDGSGSDALCFAIANRHYRAAEALVEAGVDVNRPGNHGNDLPLLHALRTNDPAFVNLLVQSGAELNRKDKADRASLIVHAAQTGNASIVSLFLDNGIEPADDEYVQLLRAAVARGSMPMVDLLVANGATLEPVHVFNAVSGKNFEFANAIVDAVGIDAMDDYTLEMLAQHANDYGHTELVERILDVLAGWESAGSLRLLFEAVSADGCELKTWDPQTRSTSAAAVAKYNCDAELFLSRSNSSVFILDGERIRILPLDGRLPPSEVAVPAQAVEDRLDELRRQFARHYGGSHDWVSAKVNDIGYLGNGQLGLITHTGGPADGTYASLFTWDGSTWALADTQNCHRFDWICHMPQLDGSAMNRWPIRRALWHVALTRNPGFIESPGPTTGNPTASEPLAVKFDFGGRRTELRYTLDGSDHCAAECVFTTSVEIRPAGANPVAIALAYTRVAIADRFMLVRPTQPVSRLYDLATGENLLGDIGRAAWVY